MTTMKEILGKKFGTERKMFSELAAKGLKDLDILKIKEKKIIILKYDKGNDILQFVNLDDYKGNKTDAKNVRKIDAWMISDISANYVGNYKNM